MKLITLTCPKCGAQMEVNSELEAIICNYCGNKMLIDREVVEQKINPLKASKKTSKNRKASTTPKTGKK